MQLRSNWLCFQQALGPYSNKHQRVLQPQALTTFWLIPPKILCWLCCCWKSICIYVFIHVFIYSFILFYLFIYFILFILFIVFIYSFNIYYSSSNEQEWVNFIMYFVCRFMAWHCYYIARGRYCYKMSSVRRLSSVTWMYCDKTTANRIIRVHPKVA